MRKTTLSLFVILIALCGSSFAQVPQWKVIKEFHVYGATATIPLTTIFTPEKKGFYRVQGYIAAFGPAQQNAGWVGNIIWTDLSGLGAEIIFPAYLENGNSYGAADPVVFSPKPGTPVSFAVQSTLVPPMNATYDVVFAIEKLTN